MSVPLKPPVLTCLLLLPVFWTIFNSQKPNDPPGDQVISRVNYYHQNYPQEKFFVHTDKPYYVLGETIWFKLYGAHASSHVPITPSGLVYVELLNDRGELLTTRNIKLDGGVGKGDIFLSPDYDIESVTTLRAYTAYSLNFDKDLVFQRKLAVYNSYTPTTTTRQDSLTTKQKDGQSIRIGLYPEGGNLVAGLESVIAVRAMDRQNQGQTIKARVFDQAHNLVALFKTNERGLGAFSLRPSEHAEYTVEVADGAQAMKVPVPKALAAGATLAIKQLSVDTLAILVQSNKDGLLSDAFIIGHTRGDIFFRVDLKDIPSNAMLLPTKELPHGVAHFTLFGQMEAEVKPLAERLVFLDSHPQDEPDSFLSTKAVDGEIDSTKIKLDLSDYLQSGREIMGSLSVYPDIATTSPEDASDIRTYLYWLSDLPGTIADPGYYFDQGRVVHHKEIDLVMLTHGWRRFRWDQIWPEMNFALTHRPENGFTIKGQTTNGTNDKGVAADVRVSMLNDEIAMLTATTGDDGEFELTDLQWFDTTELVLQAFKPSRKRGDKSDKKQQPLAVALSPYPVSPPQGVASLPPVFIEPSAVEKYLDAARSDPLISEAYANIWSVDLNEVEVTADAILPEVEAHREEMMYKDPDTRIIIDSIPALAARAATSTSVYEIIRGFPGIDIQQVQGQKIAIIRGSGTIQGNPAALVLIDGSRVSDATLNSFPVDRIAFVDVIRSAAKASIYGSSTGVIAIYTKRTGAGGKSSILPDYTVNQQHPGYYQARVFFQDESGDAGPNVSNVYRTLLWDPDILLKPDSATITYHLTGLRTSNYQVVFQGLDSQGIPLSCRLQISREP